MTHSLHVFAIRDKLRHCLTMAQAAQKSEGPWLLFLYQLCC